MADSSLSWIFPISTEDIALNSALLNDPARLRRLRERDAQQFILQYEVDAFGGTSRRHFVELWIAKHARHLQGLAYVGLGFALLKETEINLALRDIENALDLIKTHDWSYWGLDRSAIEYALLMPYPQLWQEAECDACDHDNPCYLIFYLRQHRRVLEKSLELGQSILYFQYHAEI